jgi:hypothetical protein
VVFFSPRANASIRPRRCLPNHLSCYQSTQYNQQRAVTQPKQIFICYAVASSNYMNVAHFQAHLLFMRVFSCQSNGMPFVLHGYPIRTRYRHFGTTLMPSVWASRAVRFRFPRYLLTYEAFKCLYCFCSVCFRL